MEVVEVEAADPVMIKKASCTGDSEGAKESRERNLISSLTNSDRLALRLWCLWFLWQSRPNPLGAAGALARLNCSELLLRLVNRAYPRANGTGHGFGWPTEILWLIRI